MLCVAIASIASECIIRVQKLVSNGARKALHCYQQITGAISRNTVDVALPCVIR